MFLLDQSSSMRSDVPWSPEKTRWDEVRSELEYLFANLSDESLYFGIDAFPDGTLQYFERCNDSCCADPECIMSDFMRCLNLATSCSRLCSVDLPPVISLSDKSTSGLEISTYMDLPYLPGTFTCTPLIDQLRYYNQDLFRDA